MKKYLIAILFIAQYAAMGTAEAKGTAEDANKRFDAYKERFVLALWQMYPSWASSVGYHKYDDQLTIPDDASRTRELAFCKAHLDTLSRYKLTELNDANKTDYYLISNQLKYSQWGINAQKAYEWDPSSYNVSGGIAEILNNDYEPLEARLRSVYKRMLLVPAYYEAAKRTIKNPTVEHTNLAIEQNMGGLSVFEQDLQDALKKSNLPEEEKGQINLRSKNTVSVIKAYTEWLKQLPNKTPRSFRLGKELYGRKFAYELQSRYTADEIYKKALAHKAELHERMYTLAKHLWRKYFDVKDFPADKLQAIKQVIDAISVTHVQKEYFQEAIEKQIPVLVQFVKTKDLIYIDPTKPLVIRKEPAYMAGVAGASISAPGPYDKNGNTYYNVGSLEGWDTARAESYLREYNHYILPILNIHEAIPGHYTQLVYANQSPSIIKSILGNNAMIEGWAVYAERMMLENGFDIDNLTAKEASEEMWLMYFKWNLRSTCNTILDYSVHNGEMTKEEAMHLLVNEAFQQQAEAEGKWKRVSVTQVQLCCYFTGYTEIYDLREELKAMQKDKFSLKKFHEQFLSYGSAPVQYIRQLMLNTTKN